MKSTNQSDNNASKTIALDHLGVIAARIRSSALKFQANDPDNNTKMKPLDDVRFLPFLSIPCLDHITDPPWIGLESVR